VKLSCRRVGYYVSMSVLVWWGDLEWLFFKCRKCESETFQSVFLPWLCVWPFSGLPQRSGSRKRLGPVSPINSHLDLTLCSGLIIGGSVQVSSCFPTVPSCTFSDRENEFVCIFNNLLWNTVLCYSTFKFDQIWRLNWVICVCLPSLF